jgi:hypothetical protein
MPTVPGDPNMNFSANEPGLLPQKGNMSIAAGLALHQAKLSMPKGPNDVKVPQPKRVRLKVVK